MLIITDKRLPANAKSKLSTYGNIYELETSDVVYDAISGHPDIFIFQNNNNLIIAPQTPFTLVQLLQKNGITFSYGNKQLGSKHPLTTAYNVSYGDGVFIGNNTHCDNSIIDLAKNNKWVQSKQSYARCNTLIINNSSIISSDLNLKKSFPDGLFINPHEIKLPGFEYGFIGGCLGIYEKSIFIIGSLQHHQQGEQIRTYCINLGYNIIELYNGPLIDGGGIVFIATT